jgi:hypothetical protein
MRRIYGKSDASFSVRTILTVQVGSIDALTENGGISKTFVGLILLPIVGNAAEHATAVTVACKDKMDLAIGVAVGSSMQIALLVLPLIIVIGWIMGMFYSSITFLTVTDWQRSRKYDPVFRCVPGDPALRLCAAGMFIRCFAPLFYDDANSLGELSHRRWQITLARGCAADNDVFDHRRGCLVCILHYLHWKYSANSSTGSIPTRASQLLNIVRYTDFTHSTTLGRYPFMYLELLSNI